MPCQAQPVAGSLLPLGSVGAVECNEAAIFPQTLESQAKDQKIKRSQASPAPTGFSGSKQGVQFPEIKE
ncbi:hypothetical protein ASC85_29710 [Pseudomonas sp. Root401]|nr:hypothetical protein ASC85_29710 [Pseudomonas sp. Root401]